MGRPTPSIAMHPYPAKGDHMATRPLSKLGCTLESILRHHLRVHVIDFGFRPSVLGDHARRSPVLPDSSTSPQSPSLTILPTPIIPSPTPSPPRMLPWVCLFMAARRALWVPTSIVIPFLRLLISLRGAMLLVVPRQPAAHALQRHPDPPAVGRLCDAFSLLRSRRS